MKKILLLLSTILLGASIGIAGEAPVPLDKDKTVAPTEFFRAGEVQVGVFGAFGEGDVDRVGKTARFRETRVTIRQEVVDPIPPIVTRDVERRTQHTRTVNYKDTVHHGFGGGIETNYFFTNNLGIGLEGLWLDAGSAIQAVSASIIYRYPIERGTWAVAPYAFIGGGGQFDGAAAGTGHFGGGFEVRFTEKWGIFLDGRWTIHDSSENYALIRTGIRLVF